MSSIEEDVGKLTEVVGGLLKKQMEQEKQIMQLGMLLKTLLDKVVK